MRGTPRRRECTTVTEGREGDGMRRPPVSPGDVTPSGDPHDSSHRDHRRRCRCAPRRGDTVPPSTMRSGSERRKAAGRVGKKKSGRNEGKTVVHTHRKKDKKEGEVWRGEVTPRQCRRHWCVREGPRRRTDATGSWSQRRPRRASEGGLGAATGWTRHSHVVQAGLEGVGGRRKRFKKK